MKQKEFYSSTAWKYLSRYVLTYYANKEGVVKCSTCSTYKLVTDKLMQCGHYIKSNNRATAFDFVNLQPQCYKCNKYYSGKPDVMREVIYKLHGKDVLAQLELKSYNVCHLGKFELDQLRIEWREKYKELLKSRNQKCFWK